MLWIHTFVKCNEDHQTNFKKQECPQMQTKLFIALHSSSITLLCPIAIKSMSTDSAFISEGTALRLCEQIALWAEAPWTSHALRSGVHGPTQKPLQGRTGQAQRVSCARLRAGGQAGRAAPTAPDKPPLPRETNLQNGFKLLRGGRSSCPDFSL